MPGVQYIEETLAAYLPAGSDAIVGIIGPATKGPVNQLGEFTDEASFVNAHGRPVDGHYGPRAAIRYLRQSNQLKFVRVAGTLLSTAYVEQIKNVGGNDIPIIRFSAVSAGSWANGDVKINILLNGDPAVSYNVQVLFRGKVVERFDNLTNSTAETTINNNSSYIRVAIHASAGTTLPDSTRDSNSGLLVPIVMAGGDDGAFASTRSGDSSTGGLAQQNTWSYSIPVNTTTDYSGSEGRYIAPGTVVIGTTAPVETFSDDGHGNLTGTAGGSGVIDYRTGAWSVSFFAAPTAPVTVQYRAGTYEIIASASSSVASYSGSLARAGCVPSFITMYSPRQDVLEVGDGATAAYSPTVGADVVPGSVEITAISTSGATLTVTDDGNGALTGDLTAPGTINYATGAMSFTFNANVRNNENIVGTFKTTIIDNGSGALAGDKVAGTINYQTGAWTLVYTFTPVGDYSPGLQNGGSVETVFRHATIVDFGDASETDFTGTLEEYPVKAGSVVVIHGVGASLTDDGFGNLSGAGGSGTIDYQTGAISLTFTAAPASGFPIQVNYDSIVVHFTCKFAGDVGNERSTMTDGLYVWVDKSPSTPTTNPGDQWYRVRLYFNDGSGTAVIETFDLLESIEDLVDTINGLNGSRYVTAERTTVPGEADITYDTGAGQKMGMAGAFTNADVIGTHVIPNYTGLQLFSNEEAVPVHFLCAPGLWHRQIQQAGIELAETRYVVWLFSLPDFEDPYDARDFTNGEYNAASPGGVAVPVAEVPYPPLGEINSDQAFCQFPWVRYFDQYNNADIWEPAEGDVLGLIGKVENEQEPWFPIAGLRRGQLPTVSQIRYSMTDGERRLTYGLVGSRIEVINPIVDFIGQRIYLYGERTMVREEIPSSRLHIRWTGNLIRNSLLLLGRRYPFELNDEILWREIRADVDNVLAPIAARRGLQDYRIVCDSTTNTPEVIGNEKKVICNIFVVFMEAAEEIEFRLTFTPTTVDLSEVAPLG